MIFAIVVGLLLLTTPHLSVQSMPRSTRSSRSSYKRRSSRPNDEDSFNPGVSPHYGGQHDYRNDNVPHAKSSRGDYADPDSIYIHTVRNGGYRKNSGAYSQKQNGRHSISKEAEYVLKFTETFPSKLFVAVASGVVFALYRQFLPIKLLKCALCLQCDV